MCLAGFEAVEKFDAELNILFPLFTSAKDQHGYLKMGK